jgi:hypothetical protein
MKLNSNEQWIIGYEGLYSVNTAGAVFSRNYGRTGKMKEMRFSKDSNGYSSINLHNDGKEKRRNIFIG